MIFITDRNVSPVHIRRKYELTADYRLFSISKTSLHALEHDVVVIDADLRHADTVSNLEKMLGGSEARSTARLFILRHDSDFEIEKARALGAAAVVLSDISAETLRSEAQKLKIQLGQDSAFDLCDRDERVCNLEVGVHSVGNTLSLIDTLMKSGGIIDERTVSGAAEIFIDVAQQNDIKPLMQFILNFHDQTFRHSLLVTGLTAALSQRAGFSRDACQTMTEGALVHDIGKSLIPLSILDKPGSLTDEERNLIMLHPRFGYDYLKKRHCLSEDILSIVLHHHEMLDGTGYPDKLRDHQIPPYVRLVTICDIYSALVEPRSYKAAHPPMLAFAIMLGMTGKLDPKLLSVFREIALEQTVDVA